MTQDTLIKISFAISGVSLVVAIGALKAISGGSAQSGSWDGWIKISGANWGPVLQSDGYFSGFLWGSDVVGWASAALLHTNYEPCQAAYSCNGQTIVHLSGQCQTSDVTTCVEPSFCAAGSAVCLVPSPQFNAGQNGLTGHLQARPTVVRPGGTAQLFWKVSNVENCVVTGSNGDQWNATRVGSERYDHFSHHW